MAGCFLAVCCGMRLIIRVFQFLEGPKPWDPWKRPSDPIMGLILGIKLRNTLVIEPCRPSHRGANNPARAKISGPTCMAIADEGRVAAIKRGTKMGRTPNLDDHA